MEIDIINKLNPLALVLEPREVYDEAIIDVDEMGRAVYSIMKVVECGIKEHGSYEASFEWHDYNTFCAHVGEMTPHFMGEDEE